jgi:hypothetical protein
MTPEFLTRTSSGDQPSGNSKSLYQNELLAVAGRARHSVRAALCQPDDGAHGVTRPTFNRHSVTHSKSFLRTVGRLRTGLHIRMSGLTLRLNR